MSNNIAELEVHLNAYYDQMLKKPYADLRPRDLLKVNQALGMHLYALKGTDAGSHDPQWGHDLANKAGAVYGARPFNGGSIVCSRASSEGVPLGKITDRAKALEERFGRFKVEETSIHLQENATAGRIHMRIFEDVIRDPMGALEETAKKQPAPDSSGTVRSWSMPELSRRVAVMSLVLGDRFREPRINFRADFRTDLGARFNVGHEEDWLWLPGNNQVRNTVDGRTLEHNSLPQLLSPMYFDPGTRYEGLIQIVKGQAKDVRSIAASVYMICDNI